MRTDGFRIKTGDSLYFAALGLFFVERILRSSFYSSMIPDRVIQILPVIELFMLLIREVQFEQYRKRDWIGLIITGILFVDMLRFSTLPSAIPLILIYCGRNIRFRQIALFSAWILLLLTLFIIFSSQVGWIPNYLKAETYRDSRYYLGFLYSLYPGTYLFSAAALFVYACRGRLFLPAVAGLEIVSYLVYRQTLARLNFALTTLMLFGAAVLVLIPHLFRYLKPLRLLMLLSFPLSAAGSLLLIIKYNSAIGWMSALDTALNNRLSLGKESVSRYGFRLLGRIIPWVGNGLTRSGTINAGSYLYVDNMYMNYLQYYGIIASILLFLVIMFAMYRCYRMKDDVLLMLFAVYAVHGIIDDLILHLNYNPFLIAIFALVFGAGASIQTEDNYE